MSHRLNHNLAKDNLHDHLDKSAALGDYSTGNGQFDLMLKELKAKKPNERSFVGIYLKEQIVKDLQEIEDIKASPEWEHERSFGASMVEGVIAWGVARRNWLGDGSKVVFTSEYDDIKRGVDMKVCLPDTDGLDDKKIFSIAVDVTVSEDEETLRKKLRSSVQRMDYGTYSRGNPGGQLTKLKYLAGSKDEQGKPKTVYDKRLNHYVLPLSGSTAENLAHFFVLDSEGNSEPSPLEISAQVQTIEVFIKQAVLQIVNVLDKYLGLYLDFQTGKLWFYGLKKMLVVFLISWFVTAIIRRISLLRVIIGEKPSGA